MICRAIVLVSFSLFSEEFRAPRPPFIDPGENQLAPDEITYFPRDVAIARNLQVGGEITVVGGVALGGDVSIAGDLSVAGSVNTGPLTVSGFFESDGDAVITGDLLIEQDVTILGDLFVDGALTVTLGGIIIADDTNSASFDCLKFRKSRNNGPVLSGDTLGCISFQGFDGASFVSGAFFEALVAGAPGVGDMPGEFRFYTAPNGLASPILRLRITEAGVVDIIRNINMRDSFTANDGVLTKEGIRFLHNFGNNNTFLGSAAGNTTMTSAANNIGVGTRSLQNIFTANGNVALGVDSLLNLSSGAINTAVGFSSLESSISNNANTGVGYLALAGVNTGNFNTAVGARTGIGLSSAQDVTLVGYEATALNGASNVTSIGSGAFCNANNQITLGDALVTTLRCATTTITAISDRREKKNILPIALGLDFIRRLKPVKFHRIHQQDDEPKTYGLIAQDVIEALHEVGEPFETFAGVSYDSVHDRYELRFGEFQMIALKAIQELAEKVMVLEKEVASLRAGK